MLVGSVAAVTAIATVVVLTGALAKAVDPQGNCDTGFSRLSSCTYHWSSKTTHQSTPIFTTPANATSTIPSGSRDTFRPTYDVMSWAVAGCPGNYIARRLLCAVPSEAAPAQPADDDPVTGLPRPKPWLLTTAKDSTFIKAFHVETPLDLAGVLRFYRLELGKRGWTETDGAVVKSDGAVIAFTTSDGPALLRLAHQDDRTIADLSLRKPAATDAAILPMPILPMPGQVRLLLGNDTDEEAVITINEQTIELAAGARLADAPATGRKSPESQEINLPPGTYKVTLKVASGAVQNREFEVAADETWGLLAGPAGVPLPVRLY
ncbi:hypothetical protein [Bradyrhizobium sp. S69]|uniref:hypothetical protein n=1 Tax=Bradyrhizobium sp. S69 TaxID=1641856 RepID=UPI00131DC179|nr:hypothetical protein [Bradyrhizobium sp. S69]